MMRHGLIRSGFDFDSRMTIFLISARHNRDEHELIEYAMRVWNGVDHDSIEGVIRELVLKHRPELGGCCIYWIGFNAPDMRWEIGVSHASLPTTGQGCEVKRELLVKEELACAQSR